MQLTRYRCRSSVGQTHRRVNVHSHFHGDGFVWGVLTICQQPSELLCPALLLGRCDLCPGILAQDSLQPGTIRSECQWPDGFYALFSAWQMPGIEERGSESSIRSKDRSGKIRRGCGLGKMQGSVSPASEIEISRMKKIKPALIRRHAPL